MAAERAAQTYKPVTITVAESELAFTGKASERKS